MQRISPISRAPSLITGTSSMAELIRSYDWASTPLGPIDAWSETLVASINLMLHSPFPTIVSWGPDLYFLYNDAVIPTLGDKHPRALGMLFADVFPEAWSYVSSGIYACLEHGTTAYHDNVMIPILMNGVSEDHYWNYAISPVFERGIISGIFYSYRNITELHRKNELLRDSAKRLGELAAIVASSEDVILSKDLDGIITSWNHAATRVFGYTPDEMIGASILKLIPAHLHAEEKVIIENIRAGRRVEHFDTVRLTKDGRLIDVSVTISPIKDEHGRVIGASKILRDVSSRKRIEESLMQAEKIAATGRMAATIAHEINNPLEAVMNLLYLMRQKMTDKEGIAYLDTAESELARVSHIAKQTLGYYREQAAATPASLSELVQHALSIYEPRCTAADITVLRSFPSHTRLVLRRGEMMQVVSNLIANSIYAMPHGGTLSLAVEDTADPAPGVALSIADDGTGIDPVHIPHIFDAFFTTRAIGTGIGLFVVKQFIQGHGGQITLDSSTDPASHGTTFRIFLPLHTTYDSARTLPADA